MCKFFRTAWTEFIDDAPKLPWHSIKSIITFCGLGLLVYVFSLSYWGNLARCHIFDRDGCKPHLKISLGAPQFINLDEIGDYSLFPGIDPEEFPNLITVVIEIADAGVGDLTLAHLTPSLHCDNNCGRVLGFQFGSGEPQTFAASSRKIEISHLRLGNTGNWSKQYGEINLLMGAFSGKSLDNARLAVQVHCEKCQIEEFSESTLIELEES